MKTITKVLLTVATILIIVGLIGFVVVMTLLKWDFSKLSTVKYENNVYELSEDFNNISIDTETADIVFVQSDDEKCKIVCYEQENMKHTATVQDDTLVIKVSDTRKWYEHIGISFAKTCVTVYLPQVEYGSLSIDESTGDISIPADFKFKNVDISASTGDVECQASASQKIKIKLSTGDINVKNVSSEQFELSVSTGKVDVSSITCEGEVEISTTTGKVNLSDIACKNLTSKGDTGNVILNNVIATEKISVNRSTGNIKLNGCDAGELYLKTSTGDITGTLLTDKIFLANSNTGSVSVPQTTSGGKCEVSTSTGKIKITIK